MNVLETAFQKKKAFVGFIVAGDGGIDYCVDCALQLIEGGVDILEIGFPFSDPVADGPVIQRAAQRALEQGTTSLTVLEVCRRIRAKTSIPLILFTYYNPLLQKGDSYLHGVKEAGFNAILVVDLPAPPSTIHAAGLNRIYLVAPSTHEQRLDTIVKEAEGFIYYVCQKGTTGVRNQLPLDVAYHIGRIKEKTAIPIVAGFGIADRKSAKAALEAADGFVVGSAFVKLMERQADPEELKLLAQAIDPR